MKLGLAGHGRHPDTVAIAANPGDHARHQAARLGMARIAEAQRIDQRDWPRAHRKNVAQNAADTGRRALVGFDIGRVVVALHFEDRRLTVANIDNAGILARSLDDMLVLGREFGQMAARGFIRTML